MKLIKSIDEMRAIRKMLPAPVGFVPTMGYLHAGHIALVQEARRKCSSVVTSIFVNPTQFGPKEDLSKYPRDLDRDFSLLEKEGVEVVWTPDNTVMYPDGYDTWVTVEAASNTLEGEIRPGHFRGVATIVSKLFNVVQPDQAYFGQKDAQQAWLIKKMVKDLNFDIAINIEPTVREADGLAMSSRNVYLNPEERSAAPLIHEGLAKAHNAFKNGLIEAEKLAEIAASHINSNPLFSIQYIKVVHPESFMPVKTASDGCLILAAAKLGSTRLIDNIILKSNE